MVTISTHQGSLLPYIGYWNKVAHSDIHVYDTANDFSSNYMHRVETTTEKGIEFLTLPVGRDRWLGKPIGHVTIDNPKSVVDMILQRFRFYKGSSYYNSIFPQLKDRLYEYLEKSDGRLASLNRILFDWVRVDLLRLDTVIVDYTPDMRVEADTASKRLVKQLRLFTNSEENVHYYSGTLGHVYMNIEDFNLEKIVPYTQTQNVSSIYRGTIIDYLMSMSPNEVRDLVFNSYYFTVWEDAQ